MSARLFTVYLVTVSFIDTMAQLPILPPFVASLGAGSISVGVILGAYSLINMIGNVLAGPLIDRYGRRASIVGGMLVAGAAVAAYALVRAPWQLLLLRLVHGAGGAVLVPAIYAHVGDRARSGSSVGRSMGRAGASVALAALIGPALGGIGAAHFGVRAVFVALGVLLALTAFAAWRRIERGTALPAPPTPDRFGTLAAIGAALRDPSLAFAYRMVFGLTFAMGTLSSRLPFTIRALGFGSGHTGIFLSGFAIAAIAVSVLPTNRLSDHFGRRAISVFGALLVAVALAGVALVDRWTWVAPLMVSMLLYGVGYGMIFTALSALVVDRSEARSRGTAFGAYYAVFSLGVVIGPVVAGAAVRFGTDPYLIAVGVLSLAGAWAVAARAPRI